MRDTDVDWILSLLDPEAAVCPECNGIGRVFPRVTCPTCKGSGTDPLFVEAIDALTDEAAAWVDE